MSFNSDVRTARNIDQLSKTKGGIAFMVFWVISAVIKGVIKLIFQAAK